MDLALVTMNHSIAKVDQQFKARDVLIGPGVATLERGDELQSHTPEVVSQCLSARIPDVESSTSPQKPTQGVDLAWIRLREIHTDGLVMELSAVHLKLAHQGNEQAPVQLFGLPATAAACTAGIGVDPLQLVEEAERGQDTARMAAMHCHGQQVGGFLLALFSIHSAAPSSLYRNFVSDCRVTVE